MSRPLDTKRVLLLGATGALGGYLVNKLRCDYKVLATKPRTESVADRIEEDVEWLSVPLDVANEHQITALITTCHPDVIINCIVVKPGNDNSVKKIDCILVNSLFPHYVARCAERLGIYFIHLSTDGVFSGRRGNYNEADVPDPLDEYGCSKRLGEVEYGTSITIRTTFCGLSKNSKGLVDWLLGSEGGEVVGYKNYIFSCLSFAALANAIVAVIEREERLVGIYHIGGESISKYDFLVMLADRVAVDVKIKPISDPCIDRSLDSSRFYKSINMMMPTVDGILGDIVNEIEKYRVDNVTCKR